MARKQIGKILSGGVVLLCVVLFCTLDVDVQAFEGTPITFTISGSVGVSGVVMKGLPNNPVTDENGYYMATVNYGWKGTVTPQKAGYTFEPQSRPYSNVTSNQENQDYIGIPITFTISGTVEMEGVEMYGLPGNPITGPDGTYSVTVEYGWSGTVTPMKEGYKFTPDNKPYTSVTRDMKNQNYKSAVMTFTISGSAGVEGVTMNGLPGNPVTGRNGSYSVTVKYGWGGTVTPTKEGYTFVPSENSYIDVTSALADQDYTATAMTFTISGTTGLAGVEMKGLPDTVFTDENGFYSTTVEYGWSGTITPQKEGYTFTPASMICTKVTSDREKNYEAAIKTFVISGTAGQEGVEMNGLPGNPITGSGGAYNVTVEYGWSGMVTPMKEGYNFTPENKQYATINQDMTNQNYTAALMTFPISGNVGVDGVLMQGLPGPAVRSASDGSYNANVNYGWSGKITPTKPGYEFNPPNIEYISVMGPNVGQDYTATLLKRTITGRIVTSTGEPVEEVSMVADQGGGFDTTDSNGQYEILVDYGWRGTVAPTKIGHNFTPSKKPYTAAVTTDQTNQNFNAIVQMFTISDVVMIGTTPIQGVTITATNGGGTAVTDIQGNFSVKVPYGWSGEIVPTKEGINFIPPSVSYTNVTQNIIKGQPELPPAAPEPTIITPPAEPTPAEPTIITPPAEPTVPVEKTPLEVIQDQLEELLKKEKEEELPPAVPPTVARPEEARITGTYVDMELLEVLQLIATTAGIPIIPDETVIGQVSADLRDVPLDRALEIVLAGTPYVVKKTPYYYLVCSAGLTDPMFPIVSQTRRIKLNYVTAQRAVGLLSSAFRNYVQAEVLPEGAPYVDTYTVVVTAPPALMERIISDLEQIDRFPTHILLDARIVVMESGDLLNLGVDWTWPTISAGTFSSNNRGIETAERPDYGGAWPWGVQIGYSPDATFTNSLELALNLLAENGEARIVAKPQVLAQDGKQAQIQVTSEEYYMMTSPEVGYMYARSELEMVESGTTLTITPHIGDNNDITLQMSFEVSDSIPSARGTDLPVVTRRLASNTVRIKDGGTVALAGLTENRTRTDNRRVPGLSRIPLLGGLLFSSKSDQSTSREIAVFVTARIIPESGPVAERALAPEPTIQAPIEPAGEEFQQSLRESLMRTPR